MREEVAGDPFPRNLNPSSDGPTPHTLTAPTAGDQGGMTALLGESRAATTAAAERAELAAHEAPGALGETTEGLPSPPSVYAAKYLAHAAASEPAVGGGKPQKLGLP